MAKNKIQLEYVWKDRKRTFLGLPWSFTRYRLTADKLITEVGFFTLKEEELRLYRIMDLSMTRRFTQRIFRLGTIVVKSTDKTTPELHLKNIKHPDVVKEMLSKLIEEERMRKRVSGRELMTDNEGIIDDDPDDLSADLNEN